MINICAQLDLLHSNMCILYKSKSKHRIFFTMSSFAFDEEFSFEMNTRMNLEAAKAAKVAKVKKACLHTAMQIETIGNMITESICGISRSQTKSSKLKKLGKDLSDL